MTHRGFLPDIRAKSPNDNSGCSFGKKIQVNVGARNGEPVAGKRHTYSDGVNTWHSIRIPHNANAEPEWRDYQMTFPLDLYADAIGCTGWDWKARCSRWVGFDFDAITSHAEGVGISDADLALVREKAQALPYVSVRKSTGGSGLHLYVEFDAEGVPTENHTVHAALARCILGMMSSEAGFDFASHIDCCGSVLLPHCMCAGNTFPLPTSSCRWSA